MLLDGSVVNTGDRVYHMSGGYGIVETIRNDIARIRMDSGGVFNMRNNGMSGGRKIFYWYQPKMVLPVKGMEKIHDKAIKVAIAAIEIATAGGGDNG